MLLSVFFHEGGQKLELLPSTAWGGARPPYCTPPHTRWVANRACVGLLISTLPTHRHHPQQHEAHPHRSTPPPLARARAPRQRHPWYGPWPQLLPRRAGAASPLSSSAPRCPSARFRCAAPDGLSMVPTVTLRSLPCQRPAGDSDRPTVVVALLVRLTRKGPPPRDHGTTCNDDVDPL